MHLGSAARNDIKKSVALAREISGLAFGVYVGDLPLGRDSATAWHAQMPSPESAVLIALDPDARSIDIVTGTDAHVVLNNRSCEFALLAFQSCAAAGDIVGGIREALVVLAEHARQPKVYHLDEPA
jgi:Domain of unknown function (DUF5130)